MRRAALVTLALAAGTTPLWGGSTSLAASAATPRDHAARLAEANAAYERGSFEEARRTYAELAAAGVDHETVYFNLGCSLARLGRHGEAALAFRRALRYAPGDRDARENLAWVRARLPDLPEQAADWRDVLARAAALVPFGLGFMLAVAAAWAGAALLAAAWSGMASPRASARMLRLGAACLVLAAAVGAAPATRIWVAASEDRAVVLEPRVDARSGPGDSHPVLFTAHEGFEVKVRELRAGWARVAAPGGLVAWVPEDSLASIDPSGPGAPWPAPEAAGALSGATPGAGGPSVGSAGSD